MWLGRRGESQEGDLGVQGYRVVRDTSVCLWVVGKEAVKREVWPAPGELGRGRGQERVPKPEGEGPGGL